MDNRKRILKYLLTAAVVIGTAAIVMVFFQFRGHRLSPIPIPDIATKAVMSIAKLHQTATKDGKIQWELVADTAQMEADTGRMRLTAPKVKFNTDDGAKVLLTADQGLLDTRSNDMQVTGNVCLRDDRYTLVTETLVYQHEQRLLSTDTPVKITHTAFDLRANSMTYNLDQSLAQFDGQVEGTLNENPTL